MKLFYKFESWLDNKLTSLAHHNRIECSACGEFNKRGYSCRCGGNLFGAKK